MPRCGDGIIIGIAADRKAAIAHSGKSWDCPRCAKIRAKRLRARILAAGCNRGFDLTIRHLPHRTIEEETALLKDCWRDFRLWWNRNNPGKKIECMGFWEVTGDRHVHLHVVARCPYVPRPLLVRFFWNRLQSPLQGIKPLTNQTQRIKYAAKYVTKALVKLKGTHRYSATHGFDAPREPFAKDPFFQGLTWTWDSKTLLQFAQEHIEQAWQVDLSMERGRCCVRPP